MSNQLNRAEYLFFNLIFVFSQLIIVWTKGDNEIVVLTTFILGLAVFLFMAIMRCSDIGCTKLFSILAFLPIAQFYLFLAPSKR